jgi:hypothetical protein
MPDQFAYRPSWRALLPLLTLAALGGALLGAGLFQEPQRSWANVLLASNYLIGLSTGSLVLIALLEVSGARWSAPLRRLPEALAAGLPVGAVGLIAVLLFRPSLYVWAAHDASAEEPLSPLRSLWLERPLFLLRAVAYLAVWLFFTLVIIRNSRLQDVADDPAPTRRISRLSAGFLVAFGITCWLSGDDWLRSLEADWTSTIFAVYHFAGLFLSALASFALLAVCFRRGTPLEAFVTDDRLHDLGKLLFAFSSFWAYTWFCQYLLIWYTNHPEETAWLQRREAAPWSALLLLALALNWGVPFLVLLFRDAKRSPVVLGAVALVVLAGRWVDLFVIIFPSQGEMLDMPGKIEGGAMLCATGLFGLVVLRALAAAPLVPLKGALRSTSLSGEGPAGDAASSLRALPQG